MRLRNLLDQTVKMKMFVVDRHSVVNNVMRREPPSRDGNVAFLLINSIPFP